MLFPSAEAVAAEASLAGAALATFPVLLLLFGALETDLVLLTATDLGFVDFDLTCDDFGLADFGLQFADLGLDDLGIGVFALLGLATLVFAPLAVLLFDLSAPAVLLVDFDGLMELLEVCPAADAPTVDLDIFEVRLA